jgi:hypothetical protein
MSTNLSVVIDPMAHKAAFIIHVDHDLLTITCHRLLPNDIGYADDITDDLLGVARLLATNF